MPDDSLCADPLYCNGRERCVLRLGCAAGAVVTCQDDNAVHRRPLRRGHEGVRAQPARPRRRRRCRQPLHRGAGLRRPRPERGLEPCRGLRQRQGRQLQRHPGRGSLRRSGERRLRDRAPRRARRKPVRYVPALDRRGEARLRGDRLPAGADAHGVQGRRREDRRPARRRAGHRGMGDRAESKNEVAIALRAGAGPDDVPSCKSALAEVGCGHIAASPFLRGRSHGTARRARSSTRS